jgi:hydrogenase maturation protease
MRIIGYGNPDRGDDAAGIVAAERLRALGFQTVICTGDALELVESWRGADDVILIDAVVTGAAPGTLHEFDDQQSLPAGSSPASTHGLGLAEAVELARNLCLLPARFCVYGIEGKCFDSGTEISPEVIDAIDALVERIDLSTPSRKLR